MTSRLDRLFLLLDTGSSPVTRRAAAVQLGEVQKLHPHELHNLLAKVRKYLHSSSWDTRIAASQAVEAIISHVPHWDPPGLPKEEGEEEGKDVNGEASTPAGTRSPSHWMRFEHFDIHQVLKHSGMLLASEGSEFDIDDDLLGKSKEALLHQRRLLNRRLGLEMAEQIGLDTSELFSTDDLDCSGGGGWHRPPLPPLGPNERPFVQPAAMDTTLAPVLQNNSAGVGHIAPAPSPMPCPGLFRGPKRRASIAKDTPTSTKKSRGCGVTIKEEAVCDGNNAAEGENLWEEQSGEWPLEAFVEALCQDLFSAAWEVRHGAATALREVVRLHGRGGGRTSSTPAAQMEAANQLFLEDLSLRLLCVLALDKFGDFVSDQVVAPVRETCAQTLGHVLNLMMSSRCSRGGDANQDGVAVPPPPPAGVWGVVRVLLQLLQRPEWEARHGGLLGIKYLLAVRKDLTSVLIPAVFEPVFQGLQDQNDDVSAVAAAALVPVTEDLVRTLPQQVPRVVVTLWDALLELDDLTSSTSSILMLLAALLSHSAAKGAGEQEQATVNNVDGQHPGGGASPPPPPLVEWVPRLWPFLGHNAVAVRRSVLRSLLILTSDQGTPQPLSEWIPPLLPSMLRLLYQRCLLETSSDVLSLIYQVWEKVVRGAPLGSLLTAACPYLSSWLCLAMHPAHLQVDGAALQWLVLPPNLKPDKKTRRPGSVGGALSCPTESTPGAPLVGEVYLAGAESLNENPVERERLVLQCRCTAAKLLGLLSGFVTRPMPGLEAVPPVESPVESYARLVLFHLASKSALQRMMTAQVMAHWVTLHRVDHLCPESVRERVLGCLGETLYFDEMASAFTRLQQDARDFVALLRHFGLPLPPGDFPPSVVLTVDQVIELATTVYQGLVQQVKLRPKVQESLEDKCKGLLKMAVQMQRDQVSLNTMVQSWLATFLVRLDRLPEKLNPVIRPLMDSIRREESLLLQEESARSVVQLMSSCVERVPCPNGKIVRNLLTYLCSDPNLMTLANMGNTPSSAARSSSSSSSSSSTAASVHPSAPAILTLVNMQKSAERAPVRRSGSVSGGRRGTLQAMHSSESFDDANGLDEEGTQRQNEIQRRGATHVLSMAAEHFGAALPERLPSLWEATLEPLLRKNDNRSTGGSAPNGGVESQDSSSVPDAAPGEAQELVTTLLALEVIGPHLHPDLHPKLDATLSPLCAALDHPSPAVRHLASRCLGMMAHVRTAPTMTLVVDAVLAKLGASDDDTRRRGAVEAIACVIESLSLGVVPYLVFLVVPVLGRMSDQDEAVRLMATHCFAALVRLMPLDGAGIGEVSGGPALSVELQERRTSERHFLEQLMDARHADNYQLSVPINAELRSYQQEGVNWLAFLNRYRLHGILCDDMGLGKTLQSICILASDHHQRETLYKETQRADAKPLPSLVVCPPTLTGHWVYEVEKFVSSRYLRPLHYTGPPMERARLQEKARKHNLVVASYDIVRNDIDFFGNIRWNYCILDEGHIIKNGRTKLARALKQLQANHRLILTGTPIQNQVLDLWSLFDFLMPGFLGTERQFAQRFSRPILQSRDAKSSSREQEAGVLAMESLHRQVLPFLLRRVKDDVLKDLPPKIIQDYYCELSPLQVQLYEDFAKSRAKKTVDDSVTGAAEDEPANSHATAHVFQALQYLRKVCNHPKLVLNPQHPEYGRIMASLEQGGTPLSDIGHAAKLRSLRQLLLDCGIGTAAQPEQESVVHAHRALIFCQLKGMLDIVEKDLLLAHMGSVSYLRLDGSVAPGQRQALVQRFNADPSIDVLLLTTQVGGLGLNLTGADTVIFVEHDWNPMKDLQAMDRAHRIGQKKVVNVYRLITRGTLEEKIMGLQKFKLTIANTVITQENSSLNTMGTDQLLDLFTLGSDRRNKSEPMEAGQSLMGPSSRAGMKGVLESLPELWDSSKYDSEYDLGSFMSTLKPK